MTDDNAEVRAGTERVHARSKSGAGATRRTFVRNVAVLPLLGVGIRRPTLAPDATVGALGDPGGRPAGDALGRGVREHVAVSTAVGRLLSGIRDDHVRYLRYRRTNQAFAAVGASVSTPAGSAEATEFDAEGMPDRDLLERGGVTLESYGSLIANTGEVKADESGTLAYAQHELEPESGLDEAERDRIALGPYVVSELADPYTNETGLSPVLHAVAERPDRGVSAAAALALHGISGEVLRVFVTRSTDLPGDGGDAGEETTVTEQTTGEGGDEPPERQAVDGEKVGGVGFSVTDFQDDAFDVVDNGDGTVTIRLRLDRLDLYRDSLSSPSLYYLPSDDPNPPPITPIPDPDGGPRVGVADLPDGRVVVEDDPDGEGARASLEGPDGSRIDVPPQDDPAYAFPTILPAFPEPGNRTIPRPVYGPFPLPPAGDQPSTSGAGDGGLGTPSRSLAPPKARVPAGDAGERLRRRTEQSLENRLFEGSGLEGEDRYSLRFQRDDDVTVAEAALDLSPVTLERPPDATRRDLVEAYLRRVGLVESPFAPDVFFRTVLGPGDAFDAAALPASVASSPQGRALVAALASRPRDEWTYSLVLGTVGLLETALARHADAGTTAFGRALGSLGPGQVIVGGQYNALVRQHAVADAGPYVTLPEVASLAAEFDGKRGSVPGGIAPFVNLVADDHVRVVVEDGETADTWSVQLRGGRIRRFERGPATAAGVVVTTDWGTVADVLRAGDRVATGVQAYDEGRVRVRGVGLWNGLRVGLLTSAYAVFRGVRGLLS